MTAVSGNRSTVACAEAALADYIQILKPRVMALAVFTALVGMIAAPGPLHPAIAIASMLCIAAGAGAAGALNMWWDADIDRRMARTARRPTATERIAPKTARELGIGLAAFSCGLLALFANPLAGGLLALTILHYAVVYTMLLKRRTPYNVPVGGIAGALPPVIGWAAATGTIGWEAVLMFVVIFLWTPPHSWALAMVRRTEYERVGVPMLPVVASDATTARQILIYTLMLAPAGVALALTPAGGPLSFGLASVFGIGMLLTARAVGREGAGRREQRRLFGFSILYLFALFCVILVESVLRSTITGYGWPGL